MHLISARWPLHGKMCIVETSARQGRPHPFVTGVTDDSSYYLNRKPAFRQILPMIPAEAQHHRCCINIQKPFRKPKSANRLSQRKDALYLAQGIDRCARNGRDIAITDALFEQGDFLCVL